MCSRESCQNSERWNYFHEFGGTQHAQASRNSFFLNLDSRGYRIRREHGAYLESKSEATLVDHLNPRYLARVIRIDPWHQPYEYEGTRDGFTLRSVGPDGKSNTADDIILPGGSR